MSKRRKDGPGRPGRVPREDPAGEPAPPAPARGSSLLAQVALLVAVFVVTALIAKLAGAANLGVAIGVGQIAFTLALVALLVRAP